MKAPGVVAEACRKTGKKVYAIAGSVKDNCNFEAAFAVQDKTISLKEAMKNAAKLVEQKAELIAEIIHGSMVDLDRARKCFEEGESQDAYNLVAEIDYDLTNEGDILFCAEVCKKVQQIGSAINWYNRLLELIPDHSGAKTELQMLNSIMAFRYKDLYNP